MKLGVTQCSMLWKAQEEDQAINIKQELEGGNLQRWRATLSLGGEEK